jgi:hypothetical protein
VVVHFTTPNVLSVRRFVVGRFCSAVLLALSLYATTLSLQAALVTLDFEGLPDSTILTTQYPGLTFSNAIVLAAGISLNEFEFPPHSGTNIASDNNGPMSIMFSSPITSFSGYFTYAEPLTLQALNAASVQVAVAVSAFSNNEALSGDAGSSPNEFLQVSSAGGISSLTITGDLAGGSFVLDDATFTSGSSTVPEPNSLALFLSGSIIIVTLGSRRK